MKERFVTYDYKNSLECPCCGGELQVLTTLTSEEIEKGLYKDGDSVVCLDRNCDLRNGQISCDPETPAYINGDY